MYQMTIKKYIEFKGIGIHTGNLTIVKLFPAPENSGIKFIYKDNIEIPLSVENILNTERSITIGNKNIQIHTIEHLIAAIYMSGISNLIINVNNNEIPILDGSSYQFLKILKKAGIKKQNQKLRLIEIKDLEFISKDDKFVACVPYNKFGILYYINFLHPMLKNKFIFLSDITFKFFKKNIAPARTFGFYNEIKNLLDKGLARGGSLKNAVVFTDSYFLNKKLRFEDEPLRHKILDLIGAISILNKPVKGLFIAYRSGHSLDFELIKRIILKYNK